MWLRLRLTRAVAAQVHLICTGSGPEPGPGPGIYLANVGKPWSQQSVRGGSMVRCLHLHHKVSHNLENGWQARRRVSFWGHACLDLRLHQSLSSISWMSEAAGPPVSSGFVFQKVSTCPHNVQTVKWCAPSILASILPSLCCSFALLKGSFPSQSVCYTR